VLVGVPSPRATTLVPCLQRHRLVSVSLRQLLALVGLDVLPRYPHLSIGGYGPHQQSAGRAGSSREGRDSPTCRHGEEAREVRARLLAAAAGVSDMAGLGLGHRHRQTGLQACSSLAPRPGQTRGEDMSRILDGDKVGPIRGRPEAPIPSTVSSSPAEPSRGQATSGQVRSGQTSPGTKSSPCCSVLAGLSVELLLMSSVLCAVCCVLCVEVVRPRARFSLSRWPTANKSNKSGLHSPSPPSLLSPLAPSQQLQLQLQLQVPTPAQLMVCKTAPPGSFTNADTYLLHGRQEHASLDLAITPVTVVILYDSYTILLSHHDAVPIPVPLPSCCFAACYTYIQTYYSVRSLKYTHPPPLRIQRRLPSSRGRQPSPQRQSHQSKLPSHSILLCRSPLLRDLRCPCPCAALQTPPKAPLSLSPQLELRHPHGTWHPGSPARPFSTATPARCFRLTPDFAHASTRTPVGTS
jgi:hypothetical protein